MGSCDEVTRRIGELAALRAPGLPAGVRDHLAGCRDCARTLEAARLSRGLLAAAADAPEPPADFVDRVLAGLPEPRPARSEGELWRLGWGLVPAFAATVALLAFLYDYQAGALLPPVGLVPLEGLSAGERLVLEAPPPEPDAVLTAVMEGGSS